jgi:hypothetical protein
LNILGPVSRIGFAGACDDYTLQDFLKPAFSEGDSGLVEGRAPPYYDRAALIVRPP